jgi:DME family drug/metabolite transporter
LALASGACYGTATVLAEPLTKTYDALAVTAVTTPFSAVALIPVPLVAAAFSHQTLGTTDPRAIGLLIYLGAVTTALAYGLLYAGLRTTPSGVAVIATLIEPVAAFTLAAILLGERLNAFGVAGGVLILAAIASLSNIPGEPEPTLQ